MTIRAVLWSLPKGFGEDAVKFDQPSGTSYDR